MRKKYDFYSSQDELECQDQNIYNIAREVRTNIKTFQTVQEVTFSTSAQVQRQNSNEAGLQQGSLVSLSVNCSLFRGINLDNKYHNILCQKCTILTKFRYKDRIPSRLVYNKNL